MKNEKKQKDEKKKRPLGFRFMCVLARLFKRRPQLINRSGKALQKRAIYLMNHCGASGPMAFELYFPVKATPWGAHEMCGNYRERWNYLYHVFYRQKLHWGRVRAFIVATLFATISKSLYDAVGLIGTYHDGRMMSAMRKSMSVLDSGDSVLIFPENSEEGYLDKPTAFYSGFVPFSNIYYKRTGIDVPVYNVYYHKRKNKIIVDCPICVNELLKQGKKADEISDIFLKNSHKLYDMCVADGTSKKQACSGAV